MIDEIIHHQNDDIINKKRLGNFPMSFNGCEVIAVHNALILLGIHSDIDKLIPKFKSMHLIVLFGLFGSNVRKLWKVFHSPVNVSIIDKTNKDTALKEDGVFIISFWNQHMPFHGIHTVAMKNENGNSFTYNLYKNAPSPLQIEPDIFAGKRFIIAYKLTLKNVPTQK